MGEPVRPRPRAARCAAFTGALLLCASLPACNDDAATTTRSATPTTTTPFKPSLSAWACPEGTPSDAHCSRVRVPADWNDLGSAKVGLPVIVIPATTPDRRPDPVVVPAGGPGGSITDVAEHWSDPHRDIVLYDQRGTGAAEPRLDCPERDAAWLANLQRDADFTVERAAIVDASVACRRRLEGEGIDLNDYDTEANVRDLEAIRIALGYDQWNILGISYGARLTLAAMRSTPGAIRSVILDSVSDVTTGGLAATRSSAERAFTELVAGCAENTACAAAHPGLGAEIDSVEQRYNASPIRVDVDLNDGKGPQTFVITGSDAMGGLFQAMYDPKLIPLLPHIIGDLADGNTAIVGELVRQNVAFNGTISWGMNLSVNCADYAGLGADADAAAVKNPGRFRTLLTETTCDDWPVEPASNTFNDGVASDIPALVVAGRFDPITPPEGTKAVASRLTNSTFAMWPNRGHGVTGDPCAETVMSAFLEDPVAPVDLDCVASTPAPAFS